MTLHTPPSPLRGLGVKGAVPRSPFPARAALVPCAVTRGGRTPQAARCPRTRTQRVGWTLRGDSGLTRLSPASSPELTLEVTSGKKGSWDRVR